MDLNIRKIATVNDERFEEAGQRADVPLRRGAVIAVVENPVAGRWVADLGAMIAASARLGEVMAARLATAFDVGDVQSYGKAAVVGVSGEQEHGNALVSTVFATPFRTIIGGGAAWISSVTKVAPLGSFVDVPMNHKDEVYVRSHYDAMTIGLTDSPLPDEIAVIFAVANRGRLNARVGGLTHEEVVARMASKA
jgi:hypothetical protein